MQNINDLINSSKNPTSTSNDVSEVAFQKRMHEIRIKELETATKRKAQDLGVSYINLVGFPISPDAISNISEEDAKLLSAICFYQDTENIRLASTNPLDENVKEKLEELSVRLFTKKAEIYLISDNSLKYALEIYKALPKITRNPYGVDIKEEDLERFKNEINDIRVLNKKINDVNISDVITLVIASAIKLSSSDIHIEAEESGIVVRLRIDGILQEIAVINKDKWKRIISRLKILAKVKINITTQPQDGRFTIFLANDRKIDVRVSFLPTSFGESVVMRLLDSEAVGLGFESLGIRKEAYELLNEEIEKPNGLILTVGPTGSGKTTSLYAILNKLNRPGTKIITLENPVEYNLKGINQSQVDEKKNYTFANGLRSILRQDPDIVMVGEIRDLETSEIAIQASLTGHLVLSTLHTNDAAGVIPRLLDLGVKPFLLTPSLNAVIGQRLVRKLCPYCRTEHILSEKETEKIKKILAVISPKAGVDIPAKLPTIYRAGKGCEKCNGIGYKGRIGIYEIFTMNDSIKELTAAGAPAFKILEQAIENGMITMLQDGILKVLEQITSLDEVYDVIGNMDYIDTLYDIVTSKTMGRGIKLTEENIKVGDEIAKDFANSNKLISAYHTNEIINVIMAGGIKAEAGDVHIDPIENGVKIRFRIDGILYDVAILGQEYYIPLLGEIKTLANFPTNIKQATYDGRFSIFLPDKRMDCRVSIISGGYGETAVLRILSSQAKTLDMENLGMKYKTLDVVKKSISKTRGIVINTGPTGSGKTTTLYSILNKLNKSDIKIITIEDPIEYNLEGIMQTQIDEKNGYTFAAAIRSLMRQNPNIIMVGEIRDDETAKVAIEAALTGHLVLSTIHANSAAGAISRFVGLGIDRTQLASSIETAVGQRLVRRICPYCKIEYNPNEDELKKIKEALGKLNATASGIAIPSELKFYKGKGCEKCGNIGYKGRVGLYEAIENTPEIKKLIQKDDVIDYEIEQEAYKNGFISMVQDGILKALEGQTSVEEIFRVVD